jgi:hypothetical protein
VTLWYPEAGKSYLVTVESVYVAASSTPTERDRAQHWINLLACAGITCTSPWLKAIEEHGDPNPRGVDQVDLRRQVSAANCVAIESAQLLWFLVPPADVHTCGAWYEAGHAAALKRIVFFSGADTERSVFPALHSEYKDDLTAFATICRLAKRGAYVSSESARSMGQLVTAEAVK